MRSAKTGAVFVGALVVVVVIAWAVSGGGKIVGLVVAAVIVVAVASGAYAFTYRRVVRDKKRWERRE